MALLPGKVNLVRREVGEVLWIEGYFTTQYIGASVLIRQVIHAGPSFEYHMPSWKDWQEGMLLGSSINEGQDR